MLPILSICIPTFNRCELLKDTLDSIVSESVFLETEKVEIVISNNCSTDETESVCQSFLERFPTKIRYVKPPEPISGDENFIFVLQHANARFLKLHTDKLLFLPGSLQKILQILETREVGNVLFFKNQMDQFQSEMRFGMKECGNFDELMSEIHYMSTWIGGLCLSRDAFKKIEEPSKYSYLHFGQIYLMSEALKIKGKCTICEDCVFCDNSKYQRTRGYSIPQVFGRDFHTLLKILQEENAISLKTFEKINYFNIFIINYLFLRDIRWTPGNLFDYLKTLLPIYGGCKRFYFEFFKMCGTAVLACFTPHKFKKQGI